MLRKWEPGTVRTYLSALRQVLKYAPPGMPLPDALSLRLLHLAANRRSPYAAKALVSAVLMCQRLSFIPHVVTDTHTLTLAAIVKYTGRYTIPKPWATVQHLEAVGRLRMYWGWGRVFFLILCSVVYLWRVQDTAALQWHWLPVPGWVTFFDHKVNKHLVSYPLGDFLDTWRAYILACKRPEVPWDSPVLPGGTSELQHALQDLLRYEQLPAALWHGWKKLGAALFILLGGSMVSLQRWGRWHSQVQPRRYSNPPLPGDCPTNYNCRSLLRPPTAQCATWTGASFPYPSYGPKIPSSNRLPPLSGHPSSWNALVRPPSHRPRRHVILRPPDPSVNPQTRTDLIQPLSALTHRRCSYRNRRIKRQVAYLQPLTPSLQSPHLRKQWLPLLQLVTLGVPLWALTLALGIWGYAPSRCSITPWL